MDVNTISLTWGDIFEICERVIKRYEWKDISYIKFLLDDFNEYLKSEGIASMYDKIDIWYFRIPIQSGVGLLWKLFWVSCVSGSGRIQLWFWWRVGLALILNLESTKIFCGLYYGLELLQKVNLVFEFYRRYL